MFGILESKCTVEERELIIRETNPAVDLVMTCTYIRIKKPGLDRNLTLSPGPESLHMHMYARSGKYRNTELRGHRILCPGRELYFVFPGCVPVLEIMGSQSWTIALP